MENPQNPPNPEVEQNLRHNFTINLFNSSFLTFGISLVSASVIMPLFVSNLSDSKILVGLIMTITFAGWLVPQLFTAPLVAKYRRIKRFLIPSVFFAERLPLLLMGPAIFLLAPMNPQLTLIMFFLLLTWYSFGSGLNAVGNQELFARIIPVEKRGRLAGITGAIGIGLALFGTVINRAILARWVFPNGYALLFGIAGISALIAWVWLTQIREPETNVQPKSQAFSEFLKMIPGVLQRDQNFKRFLISMCVLYFGGMSGSFLAVSAKERWGLPESIIVTFPIAMYIGQAIGNLVCGWIADRIGYKVLQIIANAANVILLIVAVLSQSPVFFYLVFFLKGISIAADVLGNMITYEFSSADLRPIYIGIYNTTSGIVFIFSPLLAGWLAQSLGYDSLFWITAAITMIGILLLQFTVKDPRHRKDGISTRLSILGAGD